jgi:TatA/E family protein of Tat protein translocase
VGGGLTNPVHLAFIAAVALIFLGPKRLPELAKSLGKSMRELREALSGEKEADEPPPYAAPAEPPPPPPPPDPASRP